MDNIFNYSPHQGFEESTPLHTTLQILGFKLKVFVQQYTINFPMFLTSKILYETYMIS